MLLSDFDYDLPEELIAQAPLPQRDASRMLVLDRRTQTWTDRTFHNFVDYVSPNDVVVVNNTRVIPARLIGKRRPAGGRVEIFLVRQLPEDTWEALVRPGGRLKPGSIVDFGAHLSGEIIDEPGTEIRHVKFKCEGSFEEELARVGVTPLPPYIKRNETSNNDRERYQTVYAQSSGAIAAPTAGLHFTSEVVTELRSKAHVAEITLHVGYGTFEPVRVAEVSDHAVSSESYEVSREAANTINDAKGGSGRVIAVGTTTVRTLESSTNSSGQLLPQQSESKLTITPGYTFQIVDALLTNFHLPRSSLLLLVSAFAGRDFTLAAYKHAVDQGYRFYSYGDCMLIL